jgi:hypothetical protein
MNKGCPICERPYNGVDDDEHHLIPRTFKGKEKILVHRMCHQKLHATFSEREMATYYHTVERLVEHPEIAKFIKWIKNKDPAFYDKNDDTKDRKKRRK